MIIGTMSGKASYRVASALSRKGRMIAWALPGLLLVLLSAGCGGGATTTSTTGSTTSSAVTSTTTSGPSSSSTSPSSTTSTSPGADGDWSAYHHDAARSGMSSDQQPLGSVAQAWTSDALDGYIYAEPLVVGDTVIVATEGNSIYALDATSGTQVWKAALGEPVPGGALPCGNIDPSGITGTPVVDVATGTVYAVAFLKASMQHELFALDLTNGNVRWHRPIDPPGLSPLVEQERGALTLSGGRVYVPFGGLYGDCGQYKGAVVSSAADGSGDLISYIVPTQRMAGIWNPGGAVLDGNGDLWVATGNSASRGDFDYGNAVVRLSPQLEVLDYFAPSDWAALNARDLDLCTLDPVLLSGARVLVAGKDGVAYLLDAAHLGNVGGELSSTDLGSRTYGAAATDGTSVYVPATDALLGLTVGNDKIDVAWKVSGGSCSPIIAAGMVWALGYDGELKAVDPRSGNIGFSFTMDKPVTRFISLAAAGGRLFVPDRDRLTAFSLH